MSGHSKWEDVKREIRAYHAALAAGCPGKGAVRLTGWQPDHTYHRPRWWWSPPWKVTRPWLPRFARYEHGDEWCNPTALIVLPMLGDVVIRYKDGPLREKPCDACILENPDHRVCPHCGMLDCPSLPAEEDS